MATTTHMDPDSRCPVCLKEADAISGSGDDIPRHGDFTICWYCCSILILDSSLTLLVCPPEQYNDEVLAMRRKIILAKQALGWS